MTSVSINKIRSVHNKTTKLKSTRGNVIRLQCYTSGINRTHKTSTLRRDDLKWLIKSFANPHTDGGTVVER